MTTERPEYDPADFEPALRQQVKPFTPFTTGEVIRAVGIKLAELRSELTVDIVQLREQVGGCRNDIAALEARCETLEAELAELRGARRLKLVSPAGPGVMIA